MLKRYHGTDMVWDTEKDQWIHPSEILYAPKPQNLSNENDPDFSFEVETKHFMEYMAESEVGGSGRLFKSTFPSFDEQLEGIETGEVVVISGHAKNGKTLFAESWLRSMMLKDPSCKTLFFSFEVKTRKLLMKYLNNADLPLYVPMNLKTMDFQWLYEHCKQAKVKHQCSVILIDHLHFMVDMNTKQNMSLNIGGFMRKLKQDIAIGLDMAVILIAHQGQGEKGREASIHSIRDSSFIGQEADSIIMVSRRKNLDTVELSDYAREYSQAKADKAAVKLKSFDGDEYSQGLCIVTIERSRRSGVFEFKKTFKKVGDFLEEL